MSIPSTAATDGVQFHLVEFNRKDFAWLTDSKLGGSTRGNGSWNGNEKIGRPEGVWRLAVADGSLERWILPVYVWLWGSIEGSPSATGSPMAGEALDVWTAPCVEEFVRGWAFASVGEGKSNDEGVGPSAPPGIHREQGNLYWTFRF